MYAGILLWDKGRLRKVLLKTELKISDQIFNDAPPVWTFTFRVSLFLIFLLFFGFLNFTCQS